MNENIKQKIRTVPNWPKPGIMFRDITTLLKDKDGFREMMNIFYERYSKQNITTVVGIESRGFIVGAALADRLGTGFVPVRKAGKLPGNTISQSYKLEYGTDTLEISQEALNQNDKVIVVDDLIATGGTALAACSLVKKLNAIVLECAFVVNLPDLGGKNRLEDAGYKTFFLVEFAGE